MNIIQCHNYYQTPGGEDAVVQDEYDLLTAQGHRVMQFTRHNDEVAKLSHLRLAAGTIWSRASARALASMVRSERADVVHFHNTMPLISPSAYYAARRAGAAVVQTIHNYRLICPKGTFFRDGVVCEKCMGRPVAWPAIRHACYRDSRAGSAVLTVMGLTHRMLGTYDRMVDAYITLSDFSRGKLLAGGLPADRLHIKPNFVMQDPGIGTGDGGYALFLGRLVEDKGVQTLVAAWDQMRHHVPLKILGSGPMQPAVEALASRHDHVQYLGWVRQPELGQVIRRARLLVVPSLYYEGFPKVIVEAYATGLPIIASRLGTMNDVVAEGATGRLFTPGDPHDLARVTSELFDDSEQLGQMRQAARAAYESLYAPPRNYEQLLEIYRRACNRRHVPLA